MGVVAGALYGALGVALVAAGLWLRDREAMGSVPLYDADAAADPAALARVLGLSLAAFGLLTLAFGALETFDWTSSAVVGAYAVAVAGVAFATARESRQYE